MHILFVLTLPHHVSLTFLSHPARLGRSWKGPRVGEFSEGSSLRCLSRTRLVLKGAFAKRPRPACWGDLGSGKEGPETGGDE